MSSSDNLRRPKLPKLPEDEDEILRQVEAFDATKSSISSNNVVSFKPKKKSKFAEQRANKKNDTTTEEKPSGSHETATPNVLSAVVKEREFDYDTFLAKTMPSTQKVPKTEAFPTVMKLNTCCLDEQNKGMSLFAQQMATTNMDSEMSLPNSNNTVKGIFVEPKFKRDWGESSRIISHSDVLTEKDIKDIHEGNVEILNQRSDEQLMEEKNEILAGLSPDVVQFLMRRKKSSKRTIDDVDSTEKRGDDEQFIPKKQQTTDHEKSKQLVAAENTNYKPVHMDQYESEKMEWMQDINSDEIPEEQPITFSARFDFKGDLQPYDNQGVLPNEGLHHHGDEPHRPGYTLEELMTLSRSSNAQQAGIAMQTLANVIKNERHGRFVGCFGSQNILTQLLDADLVTVMRVAMDNHHSEGLLEASVQVLAEIFYHELEENTLDHQYYQSSFNGHIQPSLASKLSHDQDFKKEASELKDIQIMNADLVLGLLRTGIVDRICYLLQVKKVKSSSSITNMLKILIRLARHSLNVAHDLIKHEQLLEIVVSNFLPLKSFNNAEETLYDTPVHYALKFIRLLMCWGRNISKEILQKYELGSRLLCYLSIEPERSDSILQESLRLIVESGRCWITCLRYGLATHLITDYDRILMRHLIYFNTHLSLTDDPKGSKFNYHFAAVILEIINAAINCAPNTEEIFLHEDKNAVESLSWEPLISLLEGMEICLKKWSSEFSKIKLLAPFCLDAYSSMLSLYSSFFLRQTKSKSFDQVLFLQKMESLMKFISPLIFGSTNIDVLMKNSISESFFKQNYVTDGRSRDPTNLPSLGIIGVKNQNVGIPMITDTSPFAHLTSIMELMNNCKKCHTSIEIPEFNEFLTSEPVQKYLRMVVENTASAGNYYGATSNWFCKPEVYFLHQLINAIILFKPPVENFLVVRSAFTLLTHYQMIDSMLAKYLMEKIVFNPDFIGESVLASILDSATIAGSSDNNDDQSIAPSSKNLNLKQLYEVYSKYIFNTSKKGNVEQSRILWEKYPYSTGWQILNNHGETLLPADWQFLPLLTMLNTKKEDQASSEEISTIQSCLAWVRIMNTCIGAKNPVFGFSRLATVFLAASDLFLDSDIQNSIRLCLNDLIRNNNKNKKSLVFKNVQIPGIDSFIELYKELIEQYQAVSYGNPLFSQIVLIPLTKGNDQELNSVLWSDHLECLRSMTLKSDDLIAPLTVDSFVDHSENKDIMRAYVKALLTKTVIPKRNPLLFQICIANLKATKDESLKSEIKTHLKEYAEYL